MKIIKDMKYFVEAPMHAFPRYSAVLLALALAVPVALAQEIAQIAKKFEGEEFSVIPASGDIFNVESRNGKYSGKIDLIERKVTWNEAK